MHEASYVSDADLFGEYHSIKSNRDQSYGGIEWKKKRRLILLRDEGICQSCGGQQKLAVHHFYYVSGRQIHEYPNWALVTLCATCHRQQHNGNGFLAFEILEEAIDFVAKTELDLDALNDLLRVMGSESKKQGVSFMELVSRIISEEASIYEH